MEDELARYLARHHGQGQELPLDLTSFHRNLRRRLGSGGSSQASYPLLQAQAASADDLRPAVGALVARRVLDVDTVPLGTKTLVMLTRVHPAGLPPPEQPQEADKDAPVPPRMPLHQPVGATPPTTTAAAAAPPAATPPPHDIAALLEKPTALEASAVGRFKKDAPSVREYCSHGTRLECQRQSPPPGGACTKVHFRRVIEAHTDVSLGDCAYLSTCRRTRTCKYMHYAVEGHEEPRHYHHHHPDPAGPAAPAAPAPKKPRVHGDRGGSATSVVAPTSRRPAQWVNVDVRNFDLSVLGQFPVIMADPPWEIHMDLPYGTMSDDEVCKLNFPKLQEAEGGLLFLWVTGRAMERAREIFEYWGYRQLEEIVWIKTNQLQKVIRTGRTGHWLNHSKEHCLVGVKGDFVAHGLQAALVGGATAGRDGGGGGGGGHVAAGAGSQSRLNRCVDCDVIVAEARETSRKPEEIYDIIERLCPGSRKVEIFGRKHNIREGWVTVGNQLPPTHLEEPDVVARFHAWEADKQGKATPAAAAAGAAAAGTVAAAAAAAAGAGRH